ncbi:hypothetical protein [Winogradskyella sp.]|uniref:hypothetical protein n=1 Tax=Winogradskyella sp. TaxID=1883156 RepID=UPI003559565A
MASRSINSCLYGFLSDKVQFIWVNIDEMQPIYGIMSMKKNGGGNHDVFCEIII